MKRINSMLLIFLGMSLIAYLSGCAMLKKEQLAVTAMDYNLVVEKTENEMLLLNIIRASKRHPMYFTDIQLLRGNMSYSFNTGSITIPFGKIGSGLNGSYSVAPNIGFSNSPSFDLVVLDSQEFMRGILTPIPMETIDYYWQSGWPKEMLLHLFIDKIEISNADGKSRLFDNNPDKPEAFRDFQEEVRHLVNCKLNKRDITDTPSPIGPTIERKQAENPYLQIELQKAGLKLVADKDGDYQLHQQQTPKFDYVFNCNNEIYTVLRDKKDEKAAGRFFLRSPVGILYYLGDILQSEKEVLINIGKSKSAKLFVVRKGAEKNEIPAVEVTYEGIKYFIPRQTLPSNVNDSYSSDRSMHVMALIEQLIDLQKKGEKPPATGAVTVIGR